MIILTRHAEQEIVRRHITMQWIARVVTAPSRNSPDPRDPSLTRAFKAIPEYGGRVLRVVYREVGSDILVVTADFDRGAR